MARGGVGTYQMIFDLKGEDRASKVLQKVDGQFRKTAGQAGKVGKQFKKTKGEGDGLTGALLDMIPGGSGVMNALGRVADATGGAGISFGKLAGAVGAAVAALLAFRGPAEEASKIQFRMSRLGDGFADTAVKIARLRTESKGVFSTAELVNFLSLQKELNIDLDLTGEDLRKLDARFTAIGKSGADGFKAITEEIKKGGGEQLIALGLVNDLNLAFKEQEKIVGRSLTLQERQTIALRETKAGIAAIDEGGAGAVSSFERITANLADMGLAAGAALMPLFQALDPVIGIVRHLIDIAAPVINIALAKWTFGFRRVAEGALELVELIARFLVPTLQTGAYIIGELINGALDLTLGLFSAILPSVQSVDDALVKWSKRIRETHDGLQELAAELGLISKADFHRARNARNAATAEEARSAALKEHETKLTAQAKAYAEIAKFNDTIEAVAAKSLHVAIQTEAKLLGQKKANGTITKQEMIRLAAVQKILRVEAATSAVKSQIAANAKAILDIETAHADLISTGVVDVARTEQLERQLDALVAREAQLKDLQASVAKEAGKPIKVPRTGPGLAADPTEDPAEAERLNQLATARTALMENEIDLLNEAGAAKRIDLQYQRDRIKAVEKQIGGDKEAADHARELALIRMNSAHHQLQIAGKLEQVETSKRGIELEMIRATTDEQRIELKLKSDLLDAEAKEIEGQYQLAAAMRSSANARRDVLQLTREQTIATRETQAAFSALGSMTTHFADNNLAVLGVAMGGLASITHRWARGQATVSEAISASGGVVAAAAAQFEMSKRGTAALLAAFETAAMFAAFPNALAMAAHGTAAILFGAIAAGAGGGTKNAQPSAAIRGVSESIDKEKDRGDRSIVINISGVVTDSQGIGLAVKQALASMDGTGA